MSTDPRQPGAIAQYKKVGKVRLIERASDYVSRTDDGPTDWVVEFLTGPARHRTSGRNVVWLTAASVVITAEETQAELARRK